ncbi:MAG: STAS domain-containing protein [Phycisphaeraceae bacterium]|nr:STAS domain-containing protein [Phycisphaeraceae bacterium]
MQIEEIRRGAVTILRPNGPLVAEGADALGAAIRESVTNSLGRFVIDASAIPFADSRGLEVILEAAESLLSSGLSLKLCAVGETLREALDLTDVAAHVEQFDDANSAVRSFL